MRIVFDTNVLISAFLTTTGTSAYIFRLSLKKLDVFTSDYILEETRRKLSQKLKIPDSKINLLEKFIKQRTTLISVPPFKDIYFSDKKDIPILSLLRVSKANYFVTGDSKLLALKKFETTLILNPREIMEILHSI